MAERQIVVSADSILKLLTSFTDGQVPLDAELRAAGVSRTLGRWVGLLVASEQWGGPEIFGGGLQPLHIRYERKKLLQWDEKGTPAEWKEGVEAPKRQ